MTVEEEKAKMIDLVQEDQRILNKIQYIRDDRDEKFKAVTRLNEIRDQIKSFRSRYPNA